MKGAVDLITLIIVACMVVSIGLMLWFYLNSYYSQVSQTGEARTQRSLETLSSCMRIEEAVQNNFFIRNCGTGLITNDTLNVYVDDNPVSFIFSPSSLDAGKTGTLSLQGVWGISIGSHSLRITNPNVETSTLFEAELPDSCVLALDFDEGSGNKAYDKSLYHNDGTLRGDTNWTAGKYGYGLKFDGDNDFVDVGGDSSLNITGDITLSAWINGNQITDQYIISKMSSSSLEYSYLLQIFGSQATFSFQNETIGNPGWDSVYSGTSLQNSRWYHMTGVYNKTHMSIYLNGELKNTKVRNGMINPNIKNVILGMKIDYARDFNGTMDSVRIYNKALTPDETLNFRII